MEIFREKNGQNILRIVIDDKINEPITLLDEDGEEYTFEKVWHKTYREVVFCVLRRKSEQEDERLNYIFRIIKYKNDLVLYYESKEKNCRIIANDFYKSNENLRGAEFYNILYGVCLQKQNNETVKGNEVNKISYATMEVVDDKPQKRGSKATMIILIISYALLLVAGVLLVSVPSFSSVISSLGICEDISARAYAITIGLMWIVLTPSIGYYFSTISPFETSKKSMLMLL